MPVVVENLDRVWAEAQRKLKGVVMHKGNAYERARRLPTTILNLDFVLGWGLPFGRWTMLYGMEGGGKTLASLKAIAAAQRYPQVMREYLEPMKKIALEQGDVELAQVLDQEISIVEERWPNGLKCVLYNVEQRFDESFARHLGVNTDELEIVEGKVIEDICQTMSSLYGVAHVHVVDSGSDAVSLEELGDKAGSAADARAWSRELKKAMRYWDNQENIGIMIAQLRSNVRENTTTISAPRYIRHGSSMSVNFEWGGWLFYDKDGILTDDSAKAAPKDAVELKRSPAAGKKQADGRKFFARVEKCSVSRPFLSAAMRWDHERKDFDHLFELANASIWTGIVRQSGSYFYLPGSESAIQGEAKLRAAIESDPDLQGRIRAALLLRNNGFLG